MAAARAAVINSGGYSKGRSEGQETGYRCFVTTAGWRRTVGTSEELSYRGRERGARNFNEILYRLSEIFVKS